MAIKAKEKANWLTLTEAGFPKDLLKAREAIRAVDKEYAEKRKPLMAAFKPLADAYVMSKVATFAAAASDPTTPRDVKEQCNEALQTLRIDTNGKLVDGYALTYSFRFGCGVAAVANKGSKVEAFKL